MLAVFAASLVLSACEERGATTAESAAQAQTAPERTGAVPIHAESNARFICDDLSGPTILVGNARSNGDPVRITHYSKIGAPPFAETFTIGQQDGAAGSVYSPLLRGGAPAGHVRTLNAEMLTDPNDAYTAPVTEVRIDDQSYDCRWLARTRFFGFDERRSFLVTQDSDGDLIYQTFDFAGAANARRIEFDGAQRSTTFSVEARGGEERSDAHGVFFAFARNGWRYEIRAPNAGAASVAVLRNGARVQSETLSAYVTGPED